MSRKLDSRKPELPAAYLPTQRVGSTLPLVPMPSARRPSRSVRPASAWSKNRFCFEHLAEHQPQHRLVARVGDVLDAVAPAVHERLRLVAVVAESLLRRGVRCPTP